MGESASPIEIDSDGASPKPNLTERGSSSVNPAAAKRVKHNNEKPKDKEVKEELVKMPSEEVSAPAVLVSGEGMNGGSGSGGEDNGLVSAPTVLVSGEGMDGGSGSGGEDNGPGEVVVGEGEERNVVVYRCKSPYHKVKETLRLFTKHYLQFAQEEELRCRRAHVDIKSSCKGGKFKGKKSGEEDEKRSAKRPDLKAITKMMETKTVLYPTKRFGALPGVDVGYQFYSRAEMVVVGLHGHWLNDIDYMGQSYSKLEEYKSKPYVFPLAVSIVLSGIYDDDVDDSEDIVYTGQGGNDLLGNKHQINDQKMLRGNLALKNNMEQAVPVRVIRGHGSSISYTGKIYTYDGLYKVIKYWAEKDVSGFTVIKYRLRRIEEQRVLTTNRLLCRIQCT